MRDNDSSTASRRSALKFLGAGGATAAAGALLAACNSAQNASSNNSNQGPAGVGKFPKTPGWKFVFVNHVTTNSFFVPTRTGLADAAAMLGLPEPQWTGSEKGNVPEMAAAM